MKTDLSFIVVAFAVLLSGCVVYPTPDPTLNTATPRRVTDTPVPSEEPTATNPASSQTPVPIFTLVTVQAPPTPTPIVSPNLSPAIVVYLPYGYTRVRIRDCTQITDYVIYPNVSCPQKIEDGVLQWLTPGESVIAYSVYFPNSTSGDTWVGLSPVNTGGYGEWVATCTGGTKIAEYYEVEHLLHYGSPEEILSHWQKLRESNSQDTGDAFACGYPGEENGDGEEVGNWLN